jgi:DNA polymerase III subunit gamma/tau
MTGDAPSPGQSPGPAAESQQAAAAPLALYRRYRPASFAEVKGQDHVTEPLRQALRSGRVNHAYLFSGPRGCGKTSSARILARSLNCEQGPTPDPCGVCASCVALAPAGPGSIDVIEIDAASHGGVDDARDLRERAFYAPVSGRFKIYIIDEAHMVTREGFNALLKLVEEPPPHLKFVFATTEPEKVIPTIRSRTHHYPFRLVPPAVLRELLEGILASEGVSYEPAVLPVVIRAGAGSVRDSLSVLDQLIAGSDDSGLTYASAVALLGYTDDRLLDEVVQAFAAQDGAAVFGAIDRVVEGGHDPRRFAADLLDRVRDLIVLAAVPDAVSTGLLDVPADRLDSMRAQAEGFGQAELARAAEIINAGLVEMRGATSPRLLLELMSAQVLLPAAGERESDLRVRLERLERRLESGGSLAAGSAGARPLDAAADRPSRVADSAAPARRRPEPTPAAADSAGSGQSGPGRPPAAGEDPAGESSGARGSRPADRDGTNRDPEPASAPAGPGPSTEWEPAAAGPASARSAPAAPAPAAPAPGSGLTDAAQLRDRWPDVLEAVRRERKVAWILLTNATVESLTEGVLTVEFAREGDAKGFANSGHDRLLGDVLQQMFGISPQVRATARPPGGQGGPGGSRGSAGPGGAGGPGPGGGGGAGAPAAGSPRGPASQDSPNGGGSNGAGSNGGSNGTAGAREAATPASPAAGNGAPAAASAPSAQAANAQSSRTSGPASSSPPASSWAPDQPPPSWDDPSEGWDDGPEDEDESYSVPGPAVSGDLRPGPAGLPGARSGPGQDRGTARPSGIDLIARELGGRIVEGLDGTGDPLA